ncbi:MAG: hotdog fold thioesterase [Saprospiraceae bacterium]|jgi:1,4-dihydroxy-2-naphthoyl-CoA hydrolase|nr:hotdog fold thioesterase [Saprospiraceae bacterium]MDP4822010.1 hotdog fold thioesterase [Saprospiraceae bacterium]MDP4998555.1 hotdog fold thioesterase [Saprospiraceae bacterium]
MIWKHTPDIHQMNEFSKNTLGDNLGMVFTEVGDDYLKATMPVDHRTRQPFGLLHGGASVALAETLGSVASQYCIDNPGEYYGVGLEINANHVRSASSGLVTGIVKPVRVGKTSHVWNIEILDEKERLVCVSRITIAIIKQR